MKKVLLTLALSFACGILNAQVKYTEEIQKQIPGQGRIVLHQSSVITDMVNGTMPALTPVAVKTEKKVTAPVVKKPQVEDTIVSDTSKVQQLTGQRYSPTGWL